MWNDENLVKTLKEGGVVVMPTDTLYGIVGNAQNKDTVGRIYKIRNRTEKKPCIILVGDLHELRKFNIILTDAQEKEIEKYKEPTSFILECSDANLTYLHRGTKTLAFRLPNLKELRDLLLKTGPLIAPSANIEGLPTAENIIEAKKYFGSLADLYIDSGRISGKASKLIKLHKDGSVSILRE